MDGELDTAQLLALYHQGDTMIRALVDEGARAIGLSLYNFLNILNINRIWLYGRSCDFGEPWLQTIVSQLRTARDQWRAQNGRASGEQGGRELPSRAAMAEILEALCGALFPMRLGPVD